MDIPKFLIADNSSLKDEIFVLHTDYPRFFLNVSNDEMIEHIVEMVEARAAEMRDERERETAAE